MTTLDKTLAYQLGHERYYLTANLAVLAPGDFCDPPGASTFGAAASVRAGPPAARFPHRAVVIAPIGPVRQASRSSAALQGRSKICQPRSFLASSCHWPDERENLARLRKSAVKVSFSTHWRSPHRSHRLAILVAKLGLVAKWTTYGRAVHRV
jgi:hypothetical protein